ncbi:hypothetical protein [Piscinibacter sakaiensis]|uniref:hypothetical protein n=1 Tax=Piscinibacter sakaiensis TaxID=1547922 RepID=UPI003AB0F243
MPPVVFRSDQQVPGSQHPRYEIGEWFVTMYYADDDVDPEDYRRVEAIACALRGSLGTAAPMFLNQHHPSIPVENAARSSHPGEQDEMHDEPPTMRHFHMELIGEQRDRGFSALGMIDALKARLAACRWNTDEQPDHVGLLTAG